MEKSSVMTALALDIGTTKICALVAGKISGKAKPENTQQVLQRHQE
jgi:cell division ATPase FtsA